MTATLHNRPLPIAPHRVHERRAQPRRSLLLPAIIYREECPHPLPALLCDQTPAGLGFTCFQAMRIGELVEIVFQDPQRSRRWRLRIVRCESHDEDTFRLGALRLETP